MSSLQLTGNVDVIGLVTEHIKNRKHFNKLTTNPLVMKLLTKALRKELPPIGSQREVKDPIVHVKFSDVPQFETTEECPNYGLYLISFGYGFNWYGIEYDPESRTFWGYVEGFEDGFGTFSLAEFEEMNRDPKSPSIERDLYFTPRPISIILNKKD